MDQECIFCKIAAGDMPAEVLYRDDLATAFRDINPVAPVHVLIVPNQHLASTEEIQPTDEATVGHLFRVAREVAHRESIDQSGYRLIINTGPDAGQVVHHLHVHLIGGRRMRYPMG